MARPGSYTQAVKDSVRSDYERGLYPNVTALAMAHGIAQPTIYNWIKRYGWTPVQAIKNHHITKVLDEDEVIKTTIASPAASDAVVIQKRFSNIWNVILSEVLRGLKKNRETNESCDHRILDAYSRIVLRAQQGHGLALMAANKYDDIRANVTHNDNDISRMSEAEITREIANIDAKLVEEFAGGAKAVPSAIAAARAAKASSA